MGRGQECFPVGSGLQAEVGALDINVATKQGGDWRLDRERIDCMRAGCQRVPKTTCIFRKRSATCIKDVDLNCTVNGSRAYR